MLETVDEEVCNFLKIVRRKGGVLNSVVTIATAKALIAKSNLEHLKALDLENLLWIKSLFRRIGFVTRAKTTSKPEIPEHAKNEAALTMHHQIVDLVEKYQIPSSMLIRIDQTYSQFLLIQLISVGKTLQSLPGFEFPKAFSLSANEKHFSNTIQSLKLLDEMIIPYVISEHKRNIN